MAMPFVLLVLMRIMALFSRSLFLGLESLPGILGIRPVHLLRVVLLRVLESNFPGDSL